MTSLSCVRFIPASTIHRSGPPNWSSILGTSLGAIVRERLVRKAYGHLMDRVQATLPRGHAGVVVDEAALPFLPVAPSAPDD